MKSDYSNCDEILVASSMLIACGAETEDDNSGRKQAPARRREQRPRAKKRPKRGSEGDRLHREWLPSL